MNGDQKTWSLVALLMGLTLTACIAIMAQCSVSVEKASAEIADCVKNGGHWNYNGGQSFCEQARK